MQLGGDATSCLARVGRHWFGVWLIEQHALNITAMQRAILSFHQAALTGRRQIRLTCHHLVSGW